jgi:hypothetical protein
LQRKLSTDVRDKLIKSIPDFEVLSPLKIENMLLSAMLAELKLMLNVHYCNTDI